MAVVDPRINQHQNMMLAAQLAQMRSQRRRQDAGGGNPQLAATLAQMSGQRTQQQDDPLIEMLMNVAQQRHQQRTTDILDRRRREEEYDRANEQQATQWGREDAIFERGKPLREANLAAMGRDKQRFEREMTTPVETRTPEQVNTAKRTADDATEKERFRRQYAVQQGENIAPEMAAELGIQPIDRGARLQNEEVQDLGKTAYDLAMGQPDIQKQIVQAMKIRDNDQLRQIQSELRQQGRMTSVEREEYAKAALQAGDAQSAQAFRAGSTLAETDFGRNLEIQKEEQKIVLLKEAATEMDTMEWYDRPWGETMDPLRPGFVDKDFDKTVRRAELMIRNMPKFKGLDPKEIVEYYNRID